MSMLCPKCHSLMVRYERNGVVVDQCTECKGLFLDRGELERLIAAEQVWRAGQHDDRHRDGYGHGYGDHDRRERDDRHGDRYRRYEQRYGRDHGSRPRRRRSFFEELFDFD